jgi:hypothetical protein
MNSLGVNPNRINTLPYKSKLNYNELNTLRKNDRRGEGMHWCA